MITGKDLVQWGFKPGKWFPDAIEVAQAMERDGKTSDEVFAHMQTLQPREIELRTNSLPFSVFLEPESEVERENLGLVTQAMDALMRVPTVEAGVIMPDACPAGTIPVGGVVAARDAIHPGFHSADICCSMAITVFKRQDDPKKIMDLAHKITHFGPTRREDRIAMSDALAARFEANEFLRDIAGAGHANMATQGDGNHFLFVGHLRSTGQPAIVTHHGSRGVGALLYKRGMAAARRHTTIVSPRTPEGAAWLDANSDTGRAYWDALQIIRLWTKENHFALHDRIASALGNAIVDRFWNEHNFVFRRSDGLFYHAKGATPSFAGFSADDDGRTLIPMNMSEPILVANHRDRKDALGFSPHGAGRNVSRTRYLRELAARHGDARGLSPNAVAAIMAEETKGLDVRFWCGKADLSELPGGYKSAAQVVGQIGKQKLAEIVDYIDPYGSIMAGDWEQDAPWRKKREAKRAAKPNKKRPPGDTPAAFVLYFGIFGGCFAQPVLAGLLSGVLFTPLAFLLALYSAGAGHGDYVFARLLFPIPMLATLFTDDTLGILSLTMAAVQFPAYGAFAGWAFARRRILLPMLLAAGHIGAIALAFGA